MNNKNIIKAIRTIAQISPKFIFIKCIGAIINALVPLYTTWLTTQIIDQMLFRSKYSTLCIFIAMYAITNLLFNVCKGLINRYTVKMNCSLELEMNKKIIYKLTRVEYSFFDDSDSYDKAEIASREVPNFSFIIDNIFTIISNIISFCVIVPYIASLNIGLIILVIIFYIPVIFLQIKLRRLNVEKANQSAYYRRCSSGCSHMLLSKYYAGEVRTFALFNWLFDKFKVFYQKDSDIKYENAKLKTRYETLIALIPIILTCIVQLLLVRQVLNEILTIGAFTLYNAYIIQLGAIILSTISSFTLIYEKEQFLKNLFEFLEYNTAVENDGDISVDKDILHSLEFKNVFFSYENSSDIILNDVSFCINKGETLAIVGLNGAGKSTLFSLILRFYKPQKGQILLDGIDIDKYNIDEYYRAISVVFQTPKAYPFSLKENILFDAENSNISNDYKWLNKLIDKYPKGIDTVVLPYFDKTGIEPSIGELQRIALAKALHKECKFLLLDEPSASMDAEIEYEIFSDLKSICKDKTAIIISHRLSTVITANNIVVLDNGKIIEYGNHKELIEENGMYADLFRKQAEKYREEI